MASILRASLQQTRAQYARQHTRCMSHLMTDDIAKLSGSEYVCERGSTENAGRFMRGQGLHGRGLFICSQRAIDAEQAQPMQYFMKKHGLMPVQFILPNGLPHTDALVAAATMARRMGVQYVVGMGAGGVLECAKVVAALLTHTGTPKEFCREMGGGKQFEHDSLPTVLVPTVPTSLEFDTNGHALFGAEALFQLKLQQSSQRYVLWDPALLSTAVGSPLASTCAATMAHAACAFIEASVQAGSADSARAALGVAGVRTAHSAVKGLLQHSTAAATDGSNEALDAVAAASLHTSASMQACPGNVARAVGIGAVGRYRLHYSEVVGGLLGDVLGLFADSLLEAVDSSDGAKRHNMQRASDAVEYLQKLFVQHSGGAASAGTPLAEAVALWAASLPLPSIHDHDLSAADFERMATAAEGDPHMLGSVMPLQRSAVLDMLSNAR